MESWRKFLQDTKKLGLQPVVLSDIKLPVSYQELGWEQSGTGANALNKWESDQKLVVTVMRWHRNL